jgi:hypothetical protein
MRAEDVRAQIEKEIAGNWERDNPHNVDLRRSLVGPTKQRYEDSFHDSQHLDLWLVLEEDPGSRDGYKIVYDEAKDMYGLAIASDEGADINTKPLQHEIPFPRSIDHTVWFV